MSPISARLIPAALATPARRSSATARDITSGLLMATQSSCEEVVVRQTTASARRVPRTYRLPGCSSMTCGLSWPLGQTCPTQSELRSWRWSPSRSPEEFGLIQRRFILANEMLAPANPWSCSAALLLHPRRVQGNGLRCEVGRRFITSNQQPAPAGDLALDPGRASIRPRCPITAQRLLHAMSNISPREHQ